MAVYVFKTLMSRLEEATNLFEPYLDFSFP
jgi:hypothetical protein